MQRLLSLCVEINTLSLAMQYYMVYFFYSRILFVIHNYCYIDIAHFIVLLDVPLWTCSFLGLKIPYCQLFICEVQLLVIIKSEGVDYASNIRGEVTHAILFGLKGFYLFFYKKVLGFLPLIM